MEYIAQFLAEAVVAAAAPAASECGVWTASDQSRLIRLAVTGTQTGRFSRDGVFPLKWRDGDAFRPAPGRKGRPPLALAAAIRLLLRAPAGALAEAALRGRREGCVPAAPVLALVFLALRDAALFRETFPRVVLDGADLRLYLDLSRSVGALNRAAKSVLRDWLRGHATLREAQRHRAALADAIRLSHFRGEDPLFAWILAAHGGVGGVTPEKVAAAEAAYPALAARREFIRAVEAGRTPALRLLDTPGLEVDSLPIRADLFSADGWRAFSRRMSPSRFLEALTMLRREGALDAEIVAQRAQAGDFRGETASLLRVGIGWKFLNVGVEKGHYDPDAAACEDAKETLSSATDESIRALDWRAFHRFSWHVADLCGSRMPWNHLFSVGLAPAMSPDGDCGETLPESSAEAVEKLIRRGADADCVLFLARGRVTRYKRFGEGDAGMWLRCFDDCRDPAWESAWKRYRRLHPTARAFFLDASDLGPDSVATVLSTLRLALEQPVVPDDGKTPLPAPEPPVVQEDPWEKRPIFRYLHLWLVATKEGGSRYRPVAPVELAPAEMQRFFLGNPRLKDKFENRMQRANRFRLDIEELKAILRLRPGLAGKIRRSLLAPTAFVPPEPSVPDTEAVQELDIAHLATILAEHPGLSIWADYYYSYSYHDVDANGFCADANERAYAYRAYREFHYRRRRKRPAPAAPADTPSEAAPDTGAGWVDWLRAHPEDGADCEWGKLGATDWIRLLSSNPEWAWRPEWRRLVPEREWKAFLRESRRADAFRPAPRAVKPGRWIRHNMGVHDIGLREGDEKFSRKMVDFSVSVT